MGLLQLIFDVDKLFALQLQLKLMAFKIAGNLSKFFRTRQGPAGRTTSQQQFRLPEQSDDFP